MNAEITGLCLLSLINLIPQTAFPLHHTLSDTNHPMCFFFNHVLGRVLTPEASNMKFLPVLKEDA